MLGAEVGRGVEASTVLLIPALTTSDDGAFLADDTMVATYELKGGWMRLARAGIGKRAFLGNSGMAGGGHRVPRDGLVAVLSAAPEKSKPGSSWLGSPAVRLRRVVNDADLERTYRPRPGLRFARALWELCRIVPVVITCAIAVGVLFTLGAMIQAWGLGWAVLGSGVVLVAAGAVAAAITTIPQWVFCGPTRDGQHPPGSTFVSPTQVAPP